jgi:hypothetical protein
MLIGQTTTTLAFAFASGHRMIDFAAFGALAVVWIFIGLLLYIEYRIIRARAEGRGPGGSPGL